MTAWDWPELSLTAALVAITGFYAWATYKILRANQAAVEVMRSQIEQQTPPTSQSGSI